MKGIKKYKIEMQAGKKLAGSEFDPINRSHSFLVMNKERYIGRLWLMDLKRFKYIPGIPVTIYEN